MGEYFEFFRKGLPRQGFFARAMAEALEAKAIDDAERDEAFDCD